MLGWLFRKARVDDDATHCVACNSSNLTVLAPEAYRCHDCGHEGGDGWADWHDVQTRARYDDWTIAQLREHAAAQLNEGRGILNAVSTLHSPFELRWQGEDGVIAPFDESNDEDDAANLALSRQTAADVELALSAARAKARGSAITLDALVDKGDAHLASSKTVLQAMGRFERRPTPRETVEAWLGHFEQVIAVVAPRA